MRRRHFLALPGAALLSAAPNSQFQIGVTDWNLNLTGQPEALDLASRIGFAGIEISLGRKPIDGKLPLDNPDLHRAYLQKSKELNCKLISTCLDILHVNGLKNDKLAQKWLSDAIGINSKLGIRNMLLPFFGQRTLDTTAEMDYVADLLRDFAPQAQKAGVTLGIENTNSAADNIRILNRTRSEAVKVFYDIGNSFPRGYDIYHEIRLLGRDRICQFHLKDNPGYLGQGGINFAKVFDAISSIGFQGFADLETSSPAKDIPADMTRNLAFLNSLRAAA